MNKQKLQNIRHDIPLAIAVGKSRKDLHWKNKTLLWSELLQRLSETSRTHETVKEYKAATRDRQAELKDVGGFVAGVIHGGRRKAENVTIRSALTLDLDFATEHFWDDFTMLFGNAGCMYTTHKHTPEEPRLRLVMPLSREVTPDEYEAVARKVAADLDIETFDDTTFEPSRLMYWPSTPKDGEYLFEVQDGEILNPDDVLATYRDWTDRSQWPYSSRVDKIREREVRKQADPLEKPGYVGAFCNEYDIHSAIENFLSEIYVPTVDENRYTFVGGTTSGGLVVYEDKFAYSHHSTDPCGGKLVNAFDLVRIHLFGLQDEDAKEGTPISNMPSFKAMEKLAEKDDNVKARVLEDRMEKARATFAEALATDGQEDPPELEEFDTTWALGLETDAKGNPSQTIGNVELILRNDPNLKGAFALNRFDAREVATRRLPWWSSDKKDRSLIDADDSGLRSYLERTYRISNRSVIQDALVIVTEENAFNPVRDFLESLEWDGKPRVERSLTRYLGAEDTQYTRAVTRKFFIAAVSRIYEPGCKFDNVLTLLGGQGAGKSTFARKMGKQWYSDSFNALQGKEAYESIQGVWIMEMAELSAMRKAEVETVKHFVSKGTDRYRVAYGKRTQPFDRQCVFIGTTNDYEFLKDPTGNRRFWPVEVGVNPPQRSIWDITDDDVDQIWAEAVVYYKRGEQRFLTKEEEALAVEQQELHTEQDANAHNVAQYLDKLLPENWNELDLIGKRQHLAGGALQAKGTVQRQQVSILEIYTEYFEQSPSTIDRQKSKQIRDIMKMNRSWEPARYRVGNELVRGFRRI